MHFCALNEVEIIKRVSGVIDQVCVVVCDVLLGVDVGVNVRSLRC